MVGHKEQINILKQISELGLDSQILGTVVLEETLVNRLNELGGIADNIVYTARAYNPEGHELEIRNFVNKFKAKYKTVPSFFAAQSYDAFNLAVLAIQRGGYNAGGIKNALYKIKDYPGVSGLTTFDENGDVVKPMSIKMIKDGEFVYVDD